MKLFGSIPKFLRNEEDASNGGGAAVPEPVAQPAPENDVQKRLDALTALVERQQQLMNPLLQALSEQPTPRQPEPAQPEYVDPDVEKLIDQRTGRVVQQLGSAQDRLDQLEFRQIVAEGGFDPEDVKGSEQLYREWRKRGITFGNQQPTRIDALTQYLGQKEATTKLRSRRDARTAEEIRRSSNQDADGESGGRVRNAPNRPDLDSMKLEDRLTKGYKHLDDTGF